MNEKNIEIIKQKERANFWYKQKKSQIVKEIFLKIYRNDYPEELSIDSFVTMTDLRNIVKYLKIKPGETFLDIGCGKAGPGLWIARETNANYVGIDLSEVAIDLAKKLIPEFGLENKAEFHVMNISSAIFPNSYFDGAVSVDTLTYIQDKAKSISEIARILRSDASFVFTFWETPTTLNDYRPILQESGFEIIIYTEILNWKQRQYEVYKKIIESKDILIREMGKEGSLLWIEEATERLPLLKDWRKIFGVVKKKK
ncbi:MAG: methyltransferase domain-containing protein [Candidatus Lokiarchaeia archaeon]|nr:methyltransferase domain-containing protein [Candidatus Lokiarchaeia archaeon]